MTRSTWLVAVPAACAIASGAMFAAFAPAAVYAQNQLTTSMVAPDDATAARVVIEQQLDALAADDANRAFSYASTALREKLGSPERFFAMVRDNFSVVYRPTHVAFMKPEWIDGDLVQGVHLVDGDGTLWLAIYSLERDGEAGWRISGCHLMPAAGRIA